MLALEEWEMENIPQLKSNALDRLVAAGKIREIDRRVRFIVRRIVQPPERPEDPLPENAVSADRCRRPQQGCYLPAK
jgi:hypothetical protein